MIRYSLKCTDGHGFESWFQSAEAYDKLLRVGMVACTECGSTQVEKALMAPRVRPGRTAETAAGDSGEPGQEVSNAKPEPASAPLRTPATPQEKAIAAMRKQVEANSDYVGADFAKQARDMYLGDAPARSIHGEAKIEEAKALIEDGVPVLPLPFAVSRKVN